LQLKDRSAYHWQNPHAIDLARFDRKLAAPVEVVPHVEDAALDYQAMSSQQLRTICTQHDIKWRSLTAGKHLSKPEMLAALTA